MSSDFERGIVTAREGDRVEVTMGLSAKCEGCKLCERDGGGELVMREVLDILGARVGDTVDVEISSATKVRAAVALYVVPVAALLLGYLAGDLLGSMLGGDRELAGAIGAIGAAILAFIGLRGVERRTVSHDTGSPRVHAIISRGSERT